MAYGKRKNIGTTFEDFLQAEGIAAEVKASALKQVLAWQLQNEMHKQNITKAAMARKMRTSRAAVDRLLDPNDRGLTLKILEKAVRAVHKKVRIELVN
jgi:DNA-binding Xre family transcriptional regulator